MDLKQSFDPHFLDTGKHWLLNILESKQTQPHCNCIGYYIILNMEIQISYFLAHVPYAQLGLNDFECHLFTGNTLMEILDCSPIKSRVAKLININYTILFLVRLLYFTVPV